MKHPNRSSEIASALGDFTRGREEGSNVCVTFTWAENKKVWAQLLGNDLNIGIFTYEGEAALVDSIRKFDIPITHVEYKSNQFLTATVGTWTCEDMGRCIGTLMDRKSPSEVAVTIRFEKF